MKLLENYFSILNEADIQACISKFGYELFADQLGGDEPNTNYEDNTVDILSDFTSQSHGINMTNDFINKVNQLKKCGKQYPEILIPEKTTVYRGENLSLKNILINKINLNNKEFTPYIYKALSKIQSWTTNHDVAIEFGSSDAINEFASELDLNVKSYDDLKRIKDIILQKDVKIPFILKYETNNSEFLFKSKYFKKISKEPHEDEVLRVTNNPINCGMILNQTPVIFYTLSATKLIKIINLINSELPS